MGTMADSPPRDPNSADGPPPKATDAPTTTGDAAGVRPPMSSNLQYMLKQPSTPWVTFDRDSKVAKDEGGGPLPDPLDAGWGEAPEDVLPLRSAPPPAVAEVPHVPGAAADALVAALAAKTPPPPAPDGPVAAPAVDVPPPPAHMMAIVDQVLSQSRPPPADPGSAHDPRPAPIVISAPRDLAAPAAALAPFAAPLPDAAPQATPPAHAASPLNVAPLTEVAPLAGVPRPAPLPVFATQDDADAELAPIRSRSPLVFVVVAGIVIVLLGLVGAGLLLFRSPGSSRTIPPTLAVSVAPVPPPVASVIPPEAVTAPAASASVARVDTAPSAMAAPSGSAAPAAPVASVAPIDPKTGLPRASYLTIPKAIARHFVFLDGKRLLGTGPRSFPVKCGEHTLAIDDRKAERVINVECGGEYIVTN